MNTAVIQWISGPVLRARGTDPFRMSEAVRVGPRQLLGEVIWLRDDLLTIQVFEDTTGLKPGDTVTGEGQPLSIQVGPGLLGGIFDGLLRPLGQYGDFIGPGRMETQERHLPFTPRVTQGDRLRPGHPFGAVRIHPSPAERRLCISPPTVDGVVTQVAEAGSYRETEPICWIKTDDGQEHALAMSHPWPVRQPRPIAERRPLGPPFLTGQRILDGLFPIARGSKAAVPGGFGTGKTVLLEVIAKGCNADVIVYVGCGERGNEMSGVLSEFPQLEDPRTGRPLMERMVIIANTSNMPVAAREASIYTGITVAEYFRDQGLHVALMADSTSRWAEALREVSGRLGELPGEGGYPAYLTTRLAAFYERAARVRTLSGQGGSLTIMGAVSPPSSDFSEPVTIHTKRYVRNFWVLSRERAQARFYPAIDPLQSYSGDAERLQDWWHKKGNPRWSDQRRRFLTLLARQERLERMARIIGKDALPPGQRLILLLAGLINEAFLRQSAFSPTDRHTTPERQNHMAGLLERFMDLAEQAVEADVELERLDTLPVLRRLRRMGEEIGDERLYAFDELEKQLEAAFQGLTQPA